jgi:hypothetical protein
VVLVVIGFVHVDKGFDMPTHPDSEQGGQAGSANDTEDQKRLRNTVAQEIEDVMVRHGVGGAVFLVSEQSSAWRFVIPQWCGLIQQADGFRIQVHGKSDPHKADVTLHYIAMLRDMTAHCAILFGDMFKRVEGKLPKGAISHKPFPGFREKE